MNLNTRNKVNCHNFYVYDHNQIGSSIWIKWECKKLKRKNIVDPTMHDVNLQKLREEKVRYCGKCEDLLSAIVFQII